MGTLPGQDEGGPGDGRSADPRHGLAGAAVLELRLQQQPGGDGRLLVILDGRPAWSAGGLPLAGLPDLVITGEQPADLPALLRTFGNDWR
jgi:hypothetical protein